MSKFFFPELKEVSALAPYTLRTVWSTGEILEVDVKDMLEAYPVLHLILVPDVFKSVHIGE